MTRRAFFVALGGLACGGALPQAAEAKPEYVDAPNITLTIHKCEKNALWPAFGTELHLHGWGNEDAEYRLVARKVT